MSNRIKEDEKNEKIIRGLLKLPENRKCINCNSLGPQYVCTTFWTFICTTCSGVHREFTHRVKSVSMAKFSPQEVEALQNGGNERAKEIYLKEWDPQRHSAPDSSNIDGIRTFIKSVYVDRKYSGERGVDPLGRGDRKDSKENNYGPHRIGGMSPGGKSPEQRCDDRGYSGRNFRAIVDRRSLSNYEETYKKSPRRFEVVDDRFRDDNFQEGNHQKINENRTFPNRAKMEKRSNSNQNKPATSSPPRVRPVTDLLGKDVPALWIGEPQKSDDTRAADDSACTQKETCSSSIDSNGGKAAELKRGNSGSLIDFADDPEPSVVAIQNDLFPGLSVSQAPEAASLGSSDFLSLNNSAQENATVASTNPATPASILDQLSVQTTEPVASISTVSVGDIDSLTQPSSDGQLQAIQQQPSPCPGADAQSTSINSSQPVKDAPNGQSWNLALAPDSQMLLTAQAVQPSQVASLQPQESKEEAPDSNAVDAKKNVRKALPEDIFTLYATAPASVWQPRPHMGLNFGGHQPTTMPMSVFPESSKSMNPFDFATEPAQGPAVTFPSMPSLQGALPNMNISSCSAAPNLQWVSSQSLALPLSPSAGCYIAQHPPGSLEPVSQMGMGSFINDGVVQVSHGADNQSVHRGHQQSVMDNFTSPGGNPFG